LIVIYTGIPANANDPVWFPPWMRLVQRAAYFDQMTPEEEVGPQLQKRGLSMKDVRYVVLTHLHQDHDGGLRHFPNAEIIVARAEWEAAIGLKGQLGGYLNQRWLKWLSPTLIDFENDAYGAFSHSHPLAEHGDVHLVSTPGHSAGDPSYCR
jgi:N-acyl homoserine lactone hydrolase